MFRKFCFVAWVFSAATGPALAETKPLSAGHLQEAAIMGLNPHVFSRVDIAQIESETSCSDQRQRMRYILQKKEKAGEDISDPFTSSQWLMPGGCMRRGGVSIGF